jgi:hypothetical protein
VLFGKRIIPVNLGLLEKEGAVPLHIYRPRKPGRKRKVAQRNLSPRGP